VFHSNIESTSPFSDDAGKRIVPRVALIFGFSALLVLMGVLALDSIRSLGELETSNSQVRRNYLNLERTLRQIRVSIYESGNLLREYTRTDSSPRTRDSNAAQLQEMRGHANAALESCLRQSPPNLQEPVRQLATELEGYWHAAHHTLSNGVHKKNQVRLHQATLDQRAAVLAITGEVSRINELELRQAELEISNLFARSRARLQNFSAVAIGIGLILAVASIGYVSRLENRAEEKCLEGLRYYDELRELSNRLVEAQEGGQRVISRELHAEITKTLGALLIHVQDLLDDPQAFGSSRAGLQKIRMLATEANHNLRSAAALLQPSLMVHPIGTPSSGVDLSKQR